MARPMPVLPEVGSMMVPPGCKAPLRSASSTMARAMRSLMEPAGLARSALIQTSLPGNRRFHANVRGLANRFEDVLGFHETLPKKEVAARAGKDIQLTRCARSGQNRAHELFQFEGGLAPSGVVSAVAVSAVGCRCGAGADGFAGGSGISPGGACIWPAFRAGVLRAGAGGVPLP